MPCITQAILLPFNDYQMHVCIFVIAVCSRHFTHLWIAIGGWLQNQLLLVRLLYASHWNHSLQRWSVNWQDEGEGIYSMSSTHVQPGFALGKGHLDQIGGNIFTG